MKYRRDAKIFKQALSTPFIFSVIIPLVFLDVWMEIYHHICFRLYGIPTIKRSKYIKIDRHKLSYLNIIEKACCAYCGYANGLLNYAVVIAGETERYWCGIKHKKDRNFKEPDHHKEFIEYDDKEEFDKKYL